MGRGSAILRRRHCYLSGLGPKCNSCWRAFEMENQFYGLTNAINVRWRWPEYWYPRCMKESGTRDCSRCCRVRRMKFEKKAMLRWRGSFIHSTFPPCAVISAPLYAWENLIWVILKVRDAIMPTTIVLLNFFIFSLRKQIGRAHV